jgi:hypothetical protein
MAAGVVEVHTGQAVPLVAQVVLVAAALVEVILLAEQVRLVVLAVVAAALVAAQLMAGKELLEKLVFVMQVHIPMRHQRQVRHPLQIQVVLKLTRGLAQGV